MAFTFPTDADPGDELRRFGQYIGTTTTEQVYAGEALALDLNGEASRATTGDAVVGYAFNNAASGEQVTIKTHGVGVALATANAVVGEEVGTNAADADFADGDLASDGSGYLVLATGSMTNPRTSATDDYAVVLKL